MHRGTCQNYILRMNMSDVILPSGPETTGRWTRNEEKMIGNILAQVSVVEVQRGERWQRNSQRGDVQKRKKLKRRATVKQGQKPVSTWVWLWRELQELKGLNTDAWVAMFLLNRWVTVVLLTNMLLL